MAALALGVGACLLLIAVGPAESVAAAAKRQAHGKSRSVAKPKVLPSEVALPAPTASAGIGVTMAPVGLSIEYSVMAQALGSAACPPPALVAELQRLGSPPVQLGGVSQDLTVPGGALSGAPTSWETATLYPLPAAFWSQLQCLLGAAKDPLTVGLNVRTGNLSWATQMVAAAQGAASSGLSFSLGNEPDRYGVPNYASLGKALPGEEVAEANLYLQLASYLRPAIGGAALVGPELSQPASWRNQLSRVVGQLHEQTVGVHMYPLTTCRSAREVTLGGLLSSKVAEAPARLAWVVSAAQAAGAPAIISEANSASCGGLPGVSDSPAAAVWAVRFVLSALKTGFREVRFHLSGDGYDSFVVRGGQLYTRPMENALVALNQWLPVGSSLRTVSGVRELVATAIFRPAGAASMLILDNERSSSRPVVLRKARKVHISVFGARRAGPQTATLISASGKLRLTIPAHTVVAISATP